jgi:hypothetical protein
MKVPSSRQKIYKSRVNDAWEALRNDIKLWLPKLPEQSQIKHHVEQFLCFCEDAHKCLQTQATEFPNWQEEQDKDTFIISVTGKLTGEWLILRQVAGQYLAGSPYLEKLETLELEIAQHYQTLRKALPSKVRARVSESSPLVYLGRIAEMSIFNQNAPILISIPFAAGYSDEGHFASHHEVSHAVFEQIPALFCELKLKVMNSLLTNEPKPTSAQKILYKTILGWLNEIVADLAGTALAGLGFCSSALDTMVEPDAAVGITDTEHPVALIRPYIHLEALKYISSANEQQDVDNLQGQIEAVVGECLKYRFKSTPALMIVSLKTTQEELSKVVECILATQLDALAGKSLGDVLKSICNPSQPTPSTQPEPIPWGHIEENCNDFVLELPDTSPDYGIPIVSRRGLCEIVFGPNSPICMNHR